MNKALETVATWLNTNQDMIFKSLDTEELKKLIKAVDNDDFMAVHQMGYKIKE